MVEKNFWTDEMVSEYAALFLQETLNNIAALQQETPFEKFTTPAQFVASFREQPPSVQRDWEIESFLHTTYNTVYKREGTMFRSHHTGYEEGFITTHPNFTIHSVKRLSDREVFTVGDMVKVGGILPSKILNFELYEGCILVNTDKFGTQLKKISHSPVLFRTQDSVDIFEGDTFWYTNSHVWKTYSSIATKRNVEVLLEINKYVPFSTEELALEWHRENKPCLSVKHFGDWYEKWYAGNPAKEAFLNGLKELVKSKIQP